MAKSKVERRLVIFIFQRSLIRNSRVSGAHGRVYKEISKTLDTIWAQAKQPGSNLKPTHYPQGRQPSLSTLRSEWQREHRKSLPIRTTYSSNAGADLGGRLCAGAEAWLKGEGKDQKQLPNCNLGSVECEG
jgi:hypothetical protein